MSSKFVIGFGSAIAYAPITSGTVSGTYTTVAQTVDVSSPMPETGDIKITNNQSPNNSHEYGIGGLIEPGDTEYEVVYYKTGHEALMNMQATPTLYSWQETFPDTSTCTFPGYVKSAGIEGKTEDDALKGKIKIKVTGLPVWA